MDKEIYTLFTHIYRYSVHRYIYTTLKGRNIAKSEEIICIFYAGKNLGMKWFSAQTHTQNAELTG